MIIRKLLTFLLLLSFVCVKAQKPIVHGAIKDGVNNKELKGAVITLILVKDSVLAGFTRAAAGKHFHRFPLIRAGRYNLLVTFPGFADFFRMR